MNHIYASSVKARAKLHGLLMFSPTLADLSFNALRQRETGFCKDERRRARQKMRERAAEGQVQARLRGQRSTLTDPAVWASKPRSTFTSVPVVSIDTGPTVITAGQRCMLISTLCPTTRLLLLEQQQNVVPCGSGGKNVKNLNSS